MSSHPDWVADQASVDRPNVARMWDYYLGGFHNFAIDREAAEYAIKLYPDMPLVARVTRSFMRRAMRFLLEQGIDQFLDVGSGIPTAGNVHEIAHRVNPAARVVYVDVDPVVVSHSQAILAQTEQAVAIQADVRRPDEILSHAAVHGGIDRSRPLGLLAVSVLHFVPEDADLYHIASVLRDALPSGSFLVVTHVTGDAVDPALAQEGEENYQRANVSLHFRSHARILRIFEGLDLVEPGLVYLPMWRPEPEDELVDQPERSANYAGVGYKRG